MYTVSQSSELAMMNIINMTLKNNITTLKNLIGMRQMTLNDPKFHAKTSIVHDMYPRPAWRVMGWGGGIKSLEKTLLGVGS